MPPSGGQQKKKTTKKTERGQHRLPQKGWKTGRRARPCARRWAFHDRARSVRPKRPGDRTCGGGFRRNVAGHVHDRRPGRLGSRGRTLFVLLRAALRRQRHVHKPTVPLPWPGSTPRLGSPSCRPLPRPVEQPLPARQKTASARSLAPEDEDAFEHGNFKNPETQHHTH